MKPMHFLCSLVVVFLATLPVAVYAQDKPDVAVALADWVDAVQSGSAENITALYDNDAIMISTFVHLPITSRKDLLAYYKKVVANPDVKVVVEETHPRVFGNVAVNSGRYTLSYTQEGEEVTVPARFSFTYVLRGKKWVIIDHHSSRVPFPKEAK